MDDASLTSTHQVHENLMSKEKVLKMIPALVAQAVRFEGCNDKKTCNPKFFERVNSYVAPFTALADAVYKDVGKSGAVIMDHFCNQENPFEVDDQAKFGFPNLDAANKWKPWKDDLGADYCKLFYSRFSAFVAQCDPANGATCTVSHGDLRGDNLFWDEKAGSWSAIDFQLSFQGPIPSDLAYLMASNTVMPSVYENDTDEILQAFYSQFMAATQVYKEVYSILARPFRAVTGAPL